MRGNKRRILLYWALAVATFAAVAADADASAARYNVTDLQSRRNR